jgi:hypothetical protein
MASTDVARPVIPTVAGVRCLVGFVLLTRPGLAGVQEQPGRLLMQTIGARDLLLGAGTLLARRHGRDADSLWGRIGLANDLADIGLAAASLRQLGRTGMAALLSPVPFVIAGIYAERPRKAPFATAQVEGPSRSG